jgi:hypothetical protein
LGTTKYGLAIKTHFVDLVSQGDARVAPTDVFRFMAGDRFHIVVGARRAVPYALLRVAVVALGGNVVLTVTGDAVLVVDLLGVLNFAMAASTGWIL